MDDETRKAGWELVRDMSACPCCNCLCERVGKALAKMSDALLKIRKFSEESKRKRPSAERMEEIMLDTMLTLEQMGGDALFVFMDANSAMRYVGQSAREASDPHRN